MDDTNETVGYTQYQVQEQVRVTVRKVGGRKYLDLRVWIRRHGEWLPTNRGFSLNQQQWAELKIVLARLTSKASEKNGPAKAVTSTGPASDA
jgi:Transcriptional Coactivator p15 (PC4)